MNEYKMEMMKILNGLEENMPEPFFHLAEIISLNVLEIYPGSRGNEILIPYMMNDAIEYYLVMKVTSLEGSFEREEEVTEANLIRESYGYKLEIFQTGAAWCRIGFETLKERHECYQYHDIAHYWIREKEPLRRLVYMIGTMYDKYEFFGYEFCNEEELQIKDLVLFPPFRYWSPISEPLDERYPASEEGTDLIAALALEAGDREYLHLLKLYRKHSTSEMMITMLAQALAKPERKPLYDLILKKVRMASQVYPERSYELMIRNHIRRVRDEAMERLSADGFEGEWPFFSKGNLHIEVTEEHPFTVMESENFHYALRFMSWEGDDFANVTIRDIEGKDPFSARWEEV